MTQSYNDPANGSQSDIGNQMNTFYYDKKALIEMRKEQYFGQLADVTSMPRNFGKKIKKYHYIPMLDDQNINDQGIDAAGATIATTEWYVTYPRADLVVANASKATAASAINDNVGTTLVATAGANDSAGTGFATLTLVGPLTAKYLNATKKNAALALNLGAVAQQGSGNLYGSSKDVGVISGKLPALTEDGGFVNRVGFKRKEVEGSIEKFGIYHTYTQESLDFDSDAELEMHLRREMLNGANEITEDALQIDLLNSAGVIRYAGTATEDSEIGTTEVTYGDLLRLSIDLDNNRTPKQTKVITGTRMVDTKTISGGRVMYHGSELIPTLESMVDLHSERAYIPVQKYAAGGTVMNGEHGAIGPFRLINVPEMMKWAGAGADASATTTHHETGQRYDVFPMLVVGDGAFSTIGFQTDGKTTKFSIKHSKPGSPESYANDPYGEKGFTSIKWYYGFLLQRPERIGLIKTAAKL
jgi:N4-gp56 family major capsid protein